MIIAIPKEIAPGERRVSLVPTTCEKLVKQGISLDIEAILAKAGGALGRPHIAEALVEGGHAADFSEVFARYLGEDCPAYVPKYKMNPADAVEHIHAASVTKSITAVSALGTVIAAR